MDSALPQEILDAIIDEVAMVSPQPVHDIEAGFRRIHHLAGCGFGAAPALKACASVSHSFKHRSQRHLFAHIKLAFSSSHNHVKGLHAILTTNPALRSFIKFLELSTFSEWVEPEVVYPPLLPCILDLLHGEPCGYDGLHTLKISCDTAYPHIINLEFYKSLARMLCDIRTSIQTLHLDIISEFPVFIIHCGHSLTELRLSGTSIPAGHTLHPERDKSLAYYIASELGRPRQIPSLKTLLSKDSHLGDIFLGNQCREISFDALENFSFSFLSAVDKETDSSQVEGVIDASRNSLTTLLIGDMHSVWGDFFLPGNIDLSRFSVLRKLKLNLVLFFEDDLPMRSLSSIFQLFDLPLDSRLPLETLSITIYTSGNNPEQRIQLFHPSHAFLKLDAALASKTFHKLRAVDIHFLTRYDTDHGVFQEFPENRNWDEARHTFLTTSFPLIRGSTTVHFTIDHKDADATDNAFEQV